MSLNEADTFDKFWAIIPAGGSGTRLWPISRLSKPKFLHDITGSGKTLLQETYERILPLCGRDKILIVTSKKCIDAVKAQIRDLPACNIIPEEMGRDSATAIALGVMVVKEREQDAIIGSFAADHLIGSSGRFRRAVREGVRVAKRGKIVTIGIQPTFPSPAFGYIKVGENLQIPNAESACEVLKFVEKPDKKRAAKYLATGEYLWNAGMFIAKASTLLNVLKENKPELHSGVSEIASALIQGKSPERQAWEGIEKIAIDYCVAEPAAERNMLAVIPGFFRWSDVGDFASLDRIHTQNLQDSGVVDLQNINIISHPDIQRKVIGVKSSGIVVSQTKRVIALSGVEDIVVVDTPDALLITSRAQAQSVKEVVEELSKRGLEDVL